MKTELLLDIVKTRSLLLDNNPTKKCLVKEIIEALQRLIEYEQKTPSLYKSKTSKRTAYGS